MSGSYSPSLVISSLLLSISASWVSLDLSSRIHRQKSALPRTLWLTAGSLAMGTGIWSMHYVGMLALHVNMPVLYDWPTVLVSMLAAFLASGIALGVVSRSSLSGSGTVIGGMVMGSAIVSMHYIGMAAMRMPMGMTYSRPLVCLSVLVAIAISIVALRLTFGSKHLSGSWSGTKAASALLMGLAIPAMHYIGMAAARPTAEPGRYTPADLKHAITITALSTSGIILVSLFVLAIALVSVHLDRHVSRFASILDGSKRSYTQLQEHNERLQEAFRAGGVGIWECDPVAGLFYVDPWLRDLYGMPQDNLPIPRERWKLRVHPEDVAELDRRWAECLASAQHYENEYRIVRSDGEIRRVRSIASLVRGEDQLLQRVLGMTWDVTSERQREQKYLEQAAHFRLTLEAIGDAVIATDENLNVIFLNRAAAQLTGWPGETGFGQPLGQVFITCDEHTGALRRDPVQRCIESGGSLLAEDGVLLSRNGPRYNIRKHVNLMGQARAAVITFQDITESRRMEQELLHAAMHDSLTGLANRAAFEKKLTSLWEENRYSARTHCLCIVDLDRFKIINDTSGHMAGDTLLKEISRLLQKELRPADLAARMGGDEFMLLLPDTRLKEAELLTTRLLASISALRFPIQGKIYDVTASLGLVSFDCFSPDPEVLISQADAAVFAAKRNGRDQISVYVEEGNAASQYQEMQVVADLRRCIEEGHFELQAQPIVPAGSPNEARYFEVLLRMHGKDGKLVSPALFIPAAERFGMMGMVDRWVIRNTLELYASSPLQGSGIQLAINLSAESLNDPGLWGFVSEQFLRTAVSPASITFEVTETGLIKNLSHATDFMTKARSAGSRIALDDFGTGLSSLSYLKQFPLDTIKIDGSFIRHLADNPLDQAIIRSIGDIARSVGATTVAECVENRETIAMLTALNIDWVQGWATGRPVPLTTVLALAHAAQPHTEGSAGSPRPAPDRPFLLDRGAA